MTRSAEGFYAYALTAEYEDNYGGGLIVAGDSDFDVKAELEKADGIIVTDSPAIIQALDDYVALKRVALPDDWYDRQVGGPPTVVPDPDEVTKADLIKQAESLGLATSGNKTELTERIAAALEAAEQAGNDNQGTGDAGADD